MNHSQAIETQSPMRYVLGDLTSADRDEFEEHLADCSNCMNEVWMATSFAASAKEVFRTESVRPATAPLGLRLQWRRFPVLAFSAALNILLAAGLGYGVLRVYPALRRQTAELNEPRAIDVVSVRGVVRDASQSTQVVKASRPLLVLSFDLPQHYRRYVYSVADTSGSVVLSGEVADSGTDTLNLYVPVGRLAPGEYKTTLAGVNDGQREDLGTCLLQVLRKP
jgi:hypothetical protein